MPLLFTVTFNEYSICKALVMVKLVNPLQCTIKKYLSPQRKQRRKKEEKVTKSLPKPVKDK